jgi:23S rRNA pseudouridine2605 synthase
MKTRIAKFLADNGVASRRLAEQMILSGRVSINSVKIDTPVFFVNDGDTVELDGNRVVMRDSVRLYAFHKPINTMTTMHDPDGRRTIYDILGEEYKNLRYVGRLDYKTTGLLLMTNDGDLARRLTLPESKIPRTYIARVRGTDFSKLDLARRGITIDGIKYRPMKIEVLKNNELKLILAEGKKNEIRIVLRALGLPVIRLCRVSYGDIELDNIPVGKIVELPQKKIDALIKTS